MINQSIAEDVLVVVDIDVITVIVVVVVAAIVVAVVVVAIVVVVGGDDTIDAFEEKIEIHRSRMKELEIA